MKRYILTEPGIGLVKNDAQRFILKTVAGFKVRKFNVGSDLYMAEGLKKTDSEVNIITGDEYTSYPHSIKMNFTIGLNCAIGAYRMPYYKHGFEQPFFLIVCVNDYDSKLQFEAMIISADKRHCMLNIHIEPETDDTFETIDFDTVSSETMSSVVFKVRYLESNGYYDKEKREMFGPDAKRYYLKYKR